MNNAMNATRDAAGLPTTPTSRANSDINSITESLRTEFNLPVKPRDATWSPTRNERSEADQCQSNINFLYFKNSIELSRVLQDFRKDARRQKLDGKPAIKLLLDCLKDPVYLAKNAPSNKIDEKFRAVKNIPRAVPKYPSIDGATDHGPVSFDPIPAPKLLRKKSPKAATSSTSEKTEAFPPVVQQPKQTSIDGFAKPRLPNKAKRKSDESLPSSSKQPCRGRASRSTSSSSSSLRHRSVSSDRYHKTSSSSFWSLNSAQSEAATPLTSFASSTEGNVCGTGLVQPATRPDTPQSSWEYDKGWSVSQDRLLIDSFEGALQRHDPKMASSHSSSELRNLSQATVSDESIYEESFRRHVDSDEEAAASEQIQKELTESFLKSSITPTERIGLNGTVLADVGSNAKSRVHHLIRDLPQQPLCPEVFPPRLLQLPAALRWECLRAARAYEISLQSLSDASIRTPEDLYQHLTSCDPGRVFGRTSWKTWEQCQVLKDDVNFIFKGSLSFNDAKGQALFNVKLNPLKLDKLSRVQRKFGAKRFLFLDIPSLTKTNVPKPFDGHKTDLGQKFLEWLLVEKTFLGWRWNISTVQPIKQKSSASKKSVFERRAIFFATEGEGLKSISMQALYDWVIPLAENSYQSHCKAFTRLDLMLSQTIPTVVLEPSQVEFVDDILADGSEGSAEYLAFNDTRLRWKLSFDRNKPAIMTDGCGLMSPGMAKKICKELGIVGNRPVSFQGRINGCKGMWTISAPYDSTDPKAQEIRIEIRDSQKKVIPRPADLDPATCEAGRWTFELLRHSAPCRPAALHIDFMPILEDRGIARETIRQVIKTQLDLDFEEFMSAIDDPLKLRRWLHARNALFEKGNREGGIEWLAGLPAERLEKAILLLESGFSARGLSFVAGQVQQIAQMWLNSMREKLKIRLGKSIFAYGIADHTGCLQEGEIHFAFSESFHDKHTGDPCTHLKGEVLVARHPALRRSDMQKVRAVYKEELSHLTDIVVFSSKGSQPEAAKLQGGDYDGDTFWLCWEPKLTRQFWNAPAPFEPANVAKFGIRVDKRKVKDLPGATTDERIHTWVSENLKFRLQDDLLGRITKEHERVAYHDRSLHSRNVNDLADLHDLVIDSAKNGYSFSDADFREFRTKLGLKGELTRPEYEKFFGATSEGNEGVLPRPPVAKDGTKHITDEMLFDVVNPRISKVEDKLTAIVKTTPTADADLDFEYHRLTQKHTSRSGEVVTRILSQLKIDLQKPYQHYYRHFNPGAKSSLGDRYVPIVEECYRMYTDIQLCETDNSTVDDWLEPRLSHEPTTWALLKALTLYAHHGDRHAKFVFLMAGRELCWVKAHSRPDSRLVVTPLYAAYKPRREREKVQMRKENMSGGSEEEEEKEGEGEEEEDDEDFHDEIR